MPWVETSLEELRNRPWPPPDGQWREAPLGAGGLYLDYRTMAARHENGHYESRVEFSLGGTVVYEVQVDDESELRHEVIARACAEFATRLRAVLEADPPHLMEAPVSSDPDLTCPACGGRVAWDYTCHTWMRGDRWLSCMGCDSAIGYFCAAWLEDDAKPPHCSWEYDHGLNPDSPRAAENEARKPAWLDGHELHGKHGVVAHPGVHRNGT